MGKVATKPLFLAVFGFGFAQSPQGIRTFGGLVGALVWSCSRETASGKTMLYVAVLKFAVGKLCALSRFCRGSGV